MNKALVILCGGDSSRMGTNKALLPFKDKTLVEYIYDKFSPHFDKVYLSVNARGDYTHLGLNIQEIPDIYLNAGPMGAILSSLTMITEEKAFFMSIDTPFMDPVIADYLYSHSSDSDITTFDFEEEFSDSICAIYSKPCIAALGKCLLQHDMSKENFYSKCITKKIDYSIIEDISKVSTEQQLFAVNNREAYYMAVFSVLKNNFTC